MTQHLPHLTASLNALALILMLGGFWMIRQGRQVVHRRFMVAAIVTSAAFLAFYMLYHFTQPITPFRGQGPLRSLYYGLLIGHVVLAALVTPMVGVTAWRAVSGRYGAHRALARLTLPVWVVVSLSGILVYLMLYQLT